MAEREWGIPPAILDRASPFHLVLDADLTVLQVGSSLHRLCPDIAPGRVLEDLVELVSPRFSASFDAFRTHQRSLFLLRVRGTALTLRGQMLHDEAHEVVVFLGSPWITRMSAIADMGLTLEDFAVSDSVIDYLLLLQTQETALAQTRTLADSLRTSAAELTHQALHDELTGLPNRRLLADRFTDALRAETRSGSHTGLLVMDLDGFKRINDTFGHQYGDDLLVQVGDRLCRQVRAQDTVARLGGDEFAVLLPDMSSVEEATVVAEGVRAALELPFTVAELDLQVDASVGVVLSGADVNTADVLLRHADVAMYSAKSRGVGVSTYEPESDANSAAGLVLQGELRRAIAQGELVLHFQPKVGARKAEVRGAEALVRWEHPARGFLPPDEFMPVAEHSGLIGPLTDHILGLALTQAHAWAAAGRPIPVAVNISARNLLDEQLPDKVRALLALHAVPAERLVLEVTESALMTDLAKAHLVLEQLADLEVGISIDDFGAGYTSLSQLTTMPLTELKLDRSFVYAMTRDPRSAQVVESIVTLAHNIGLRTVGEGVETEEALQLLAEMGCDTVQGYHLARPMAAADFDVWMASRQQRAVFAPVTIPGPHGSTLTAEAASGARRRSRRLRAAMRA